MLDSPYDCGTQKQNMNRCFSHCHQLHNWLDK